MEIGNKYCDNSKLEAHQGLTAGAGIGAGVGTIAALKGPVKDSFTKSINKQKDTIKAFKESGLSREEYIKDFKDAYDRMDDVEKQKSWLNGLKKKNPKTGKMEYTKEGGIQAQAYQSLKQDTMPIGTNKARKNLNKTDHLLESGKPSKLTAAKESIIETGSKIKNKLTGLKDSVKESFKGAKGVRGKFKAVKDSLADFVKETPQLKKAGKIALIGSVIGLGAALIGKAVSKTSKED